ncbi:DNA repair protein XRCC1 isoform X3 [Nilaparvata lugens]|uniref:DNA repair protein XRCC1 isoform X3 n=1 Tax=Nilaparvata lugens TaxID=108931 RepID=UPI00193DB015|nr:DNA repair protein XRCC1 isoform X3 [Nilaparvata lugens]
MPRLQIDSVINVSSEDPAYPAKNLLSSAIGNDVKKWITQRNGEKQAHIVFKLKEKAQITNITIGNQNSSFIEVLVGDDNITEKEYQVLLPATEILTLREARGGANKTGVHFFIKDDLNKEAVEKKWSRVKVVCSQPYDPHCRYGLTCFVLKSIGESDETEKSPKRGDTSDPVEDKSALSDDTKDDINSWKQDMLKRLDASTSQPSTSTLPFNRIRLNKQPTADNSKNDRQKSPRKPSTDEAETKQKDKVTPRKQSSDEKGAKRKETTTQQRNRDPPAEPVRPTVDFNKILHDVRFSLSGYENPLRSEIRNKGLEMGAKYSNDWDTRCTHLICAFINTPKFNKVKGHGKIVTRDWIEQCHSKRRRLPWRKFALDNRDRQQPISEEDEEEDDKDKKKQTKGDRRKRLPSESSSDTEDEIQRVEARKQRLAAKNGVTNGAGPGVAPRRKQTATKTRDQLYDADTDVSEDEEDEFGGDNSDADPDFKLGSQEERSEKDESMIVVDDDDEDDVGDSETQLDTDSENDEPKKKKKKKRVRQVRVRVRNQVNVKREPKKGNAHDLSLVSRVADVLVSSDEDTNRPDTINLDLPALPDISPHTYYIADDEKGVSREYLVRYITAFDGTILEQLSNRVDYAITDSKTIAEKIIENHPTVVTVKSEWIWDSYEADKLLPTENYHLS